MNWTKEKWIITSVMLVLGGLGGYLYWHFIGCNSGTCPITSNALNSTAYGSMMGFLVSGIIADLKDKSSKKVK